MNLNSIVNAGSSADVGEVAFDWGQDVFESVEVGNLASEPMDAEMLPSTAAGDVLSEEPVVQSKKPFLKRKHDQLNAQGKSSTPPPVIYNDSSTVANPPTFLPTPFHTPDGAQAFFSTRNHPSNKSGFRYLPCGPSPLSTLIFPLYRVIRSAPGPGVRFSWEDRSPYVFVTQDGLSVTTDKGFRAARANCPIREGKWYFEVVIDRGGGGPGINGGEAAHVRIGVGRRESPLNAPVGFDAYSYGIRDKTGDKVTLSQPLPHGESFQSGDVIGILIDLPPQPRPIQSANPASSGFDPLEPSRIVRKRIPIRYKGQLYFESVEYASSKEMQDLVDEVSSSQQRAKQVRQKAAAPGTKPRGAVEQPARELPKIIGSSVTFFKNGVQMGADGEPAFKDLYDWLPLRQHPPTEKKKKKPGRVAAGLPNDRENYHDDGTIGYFPFVSVFGGAVVTLNPGPQFRYPIAKTEEMDSASGSWRPLSERHDDYMREMEALDVTDEVEALEKFKIANPAKAAEIMEMDVKMAS